MMKIGGIEDKGAWGGYGVSSLKTLQMEDKPSLDHRILGNSSNHIEKGKHFRLPSIPSKRMISELLSIYSKCFYGFAAQDQQNVHRYWRKQLPCH